MTTEPTTADSPPQDDVLTRLEKGVGHRFGDRALLERALIHRSYVAENSGVTSYERLEWLGDAVLQLAVSNYIFFEYPDLPEGEMAKIRAAVVSEPVLSEVAAAWQVADAVRLGRGEELTDGRSKPSILADVVESVIGALYLDAGVDTAMRIVLGHFTPIIRERATAPGRRDYKTRLQEVLIRAGAVPEYRHDESGPEHAKEFVAEVWAGDRLLGRGTGTSKKRAEQDAARDALSAVADDIA